MYFFACSMCTLSHLLGHDRNEDRCRTGMRQHGCSDDIFDCNHFLLYTVPKATGTHAQVPETPISLTWAKCRSGCPLSSASMSLAGTCLAISNVVLSATSYTASWQFVINVSSNSSRGIAGSYFLPISVKKLCRHVSKTKRWPTARKILLP